MGALAMLLQLLALGAMVATSVWGWQHLDPETRIRARAGTTGLDWTMSKKTSLVLTPAIGVLVVLGSLSVPESNGDGIRWLGLAVLIIFLLAHRSSVRRAAR